MRSMPARCWWARQCVAVVQQHNARCWAGGYSGRSLTAPLVNVAGILTAGAGVLERRWVPPPPGWGLRGRAPKWREVGSPLMMGRKGGGVRAGTGPFDRLVTWSTNCVPQCPLALPCAKGAANKKRLSRQQLSSRPPTPSSGSLTTATNTHRPTELRSSGAFGAHRTQVSGGGGGGRDALDGKGPQRRPQRLLDRRLEEVAKAVGGGYCR